MINYYEILGLGNSAGISEIKAAFRNLAKLYHPDKNPDGIEHFTKILKAYETLSNPTLKASYDYKLNYHQAQTQYQRETKTAPQTTKTWKFDERELKRRQYYNEHIKKYAKQTSQYMAEAETKKNYNEFKYILFATPLAVLLFLLIMHFASKDRSEFVQTSSMSPVRSEKAAPIEKVSDVKLGDAPYNMIFGQPLYVTEDYTSLSIKNLSGKELVVCLFAKKEFVRCFYMTDNISAEVAQLPKEPISIFYVSGKVFDSSLSLTAINGSGRFTKEEEFFKSNKASIFNSLSELTLVAGNNEGFKKISEKEFFNYANKQNDTKN
ncbi:hypothetical protein CNR22_11095 [Sphingobacteriaceae bacterium]|nr:hypothetical protein CNR22_11095 [Sphingobacteriaceae bacterium]